jgi:hypothetical protein
MRVTEGKIAVDEDRSTPIFSLCRPGYMSSPASRPPGPTAMTLPCYGFSWAVSGMMMWRKSITEQTIGALGE